MYIKNTYIQRGWKAVADAAHRADVLSEVAVLQKGNAPLGLGQV